MGRNVYAKAWRGAMWEWRESSGPLKMGKVRAARFAHPRPRTHIEQIYLEQFFAFSL